MENNQQVEKFDPAKLMEGVRDRIKATFVSLIPDDRWAEMIQQEVDKFFKLPEKDQWGHVKYDYSEFGSLVKSIVKDEVKKRMAEYLSGPEFEATWDEKGKPIVGSAINELILDNAGALMISLITAPVASAIDAVKRSLMDPGNIYR